MSWSCTETTMKLTERGVGAVLFLGALVSALIIYRYHEHPLALAFGVFPITLSVYVADIKYQPEKRNRK